MVASERLKGEAILGMARGRGAPALLLFYMFLVASAPTIAKDSWNIACGRNSSVTATNNLIFEGDGPYIRSGVSHDVPAAAANNKSLELSTLRAFPPGLWKKNCYRVPVEQGTKVLVRTSHYYGNYDKLDSPPSFSVYYDTALSCDLSTDSDLTSWFFCEVVYVTTKKQGTDICLIQTQDDETPFVSTIEVLRLHPNIYNQLDFFSKVLFHRRRSAFGAEKDILYPDDAYNREWASDDLKATGRGAQNPRIVRSKGMADVNTSKIDEAPPAHLFKAAVVAPMVDNRTAGSLTIQISSLNSVESIIYLVFYYTEVDSSKGLSARGKSRTFQVFKDGEPLNSSIILKPQIGVALEFSQIVDNATNETKFQLVPTQGSNLPPIVSGMEVYQIYDVDNATDSTDVETLSTLQSRFTVLQGWSGDPCLPRDYNWEWVGCTYESPRINALDLSGNGFAGDIPDFSSLDALEVINLSNNSFTGRVPDFLASFPKLQTLDLSFNDFDSLPSSLRDNKNITLITRGNTKIKDPPPSQLPGTSTQSSGCIKVVSSKLLLCVVLLASATMVWPKIAYGSASGDKFG